MKPITYVKKTLIFLILSFTVISCATNTRVKSKAVLIEHPERFFWEIKGDKGSVYVLGTMHVADESFYPIEENILKTFDNADRLVSEIGGAAEMQAFIAELQTFIIKNMTTDLQKNLLRNLSKEELAVLYEVIGESTVQQLALFNPWLINLTLSQFLMHQAGMDGEKGLDLYLMQRAGEKKVEALETAQQQLDILSYGTFEDQLAILKNTIQAWQHLDSSIKEIRNMRELYLANDRKKFSALLLDLLLEIPPSFTAEKAQTYIDALLTDRNRLWAQKFDTYLQKGGTTFVFAGAAHFLGDSSVFEIMRQKKLLE